jgi:protein involved in polysaccharide export with SLBB domain
MMRRNKTGSRTADAVWRAVFMTALILLASVSTGLAQQFEVVQVGLQGEQLQRPGGQTVAMPQQSAVSQVPQGVQKTLLQPSAGGDGRTEAKMVEAKPEKPSAFEIYVHSKMAEPTGKTQMAEPTGRTDISPEEKDLVVRHFGYDVFSRPPSTFAPVEQVPVGPDYVIGPDDEIRIAIWGKIDGQWMARVDRNGNINLPKIGVLGVTGLSFEQLKELLNREFSKYYNGFEMNVSMGSLRTIRVYVVGNVNRPGSYTVSSFATLVNALIEAGGPSKIGTMRDIQVKRNGKTVVHFDMYDLLLSGDKTKDVKLMPEDVIFVPPVGSLAAITGDVKNPAIYELRNEERLAALIQMAGGLSGLAFKGRVQIRRTEGHEFRSIFEGDLKDVEASNEKNLILEDWDIVTVFSVAERNKVVRITGPVASPGEFGIVPGVTTLKDVIAKAGGLLYYASEEAEVTRVKVTQAGPVTERFSVNLSKVLFGQAEHEVTLQENDYIFVRSVPEWHLYRTVVVSGEVRYPGTYTIAKDERLSSLIERAGGYTDRAYLRGAVFTRERVRELQQKNLEEMVVRLEREMLAEGASVGSASAEGVEAKKIEQQQKKAFIESLKRTRATGRLTIRLANTRLLKGSEFDIALEDGDSLEIPMNNKVISVVGAVMSNTTVVQINHVSAKEYIQMAGGYSKHADPGNTYVLSVDGSARKLSGGPVSWSGSGERWEIAGFKSDKKEIEAGDTIVVPEKLERIAWLREIKDITQILSNVAVAAGAVYLFSNR